MPTVDDATRTQIANIEAASGRRLPDWFALIRATGRSKVGEIRSWLQAEHGLSYGNANLVALLAVKRDPPTPDRIP